jgi:hypothetical protein
MIRKKALLLFPLWLIITSLPLNAQQEYILKGELRDRLNQDEPVVSATITIGSNAKTVTNAKGQFTIKLNPGDLEKKLIVSVTGYSNLSFGLQNKSFWSTAYKNFQINFWLDRITNVLADGDKDKVPDDIDKCPDQAGSADNYGCPELTNTPIKTINWNSKKMNTITKKNVDGQEMETDYKQLMKYNIQESRILPTKTSEKFILALNPKLKDNPKIRNGESIVLPDLPPISAKRMEELNIEYTQELSIDEKGQFDFVQHANLYTDLITRFPLDERRFPSTATKLQSINKILSEAKYGPYKKLRKIDTDMLNGELEYFNSYYRKFRGRRIDSTDVDDLHYTVSTLLKPYLSKRVRPEIYKNAELKKVRMNGPSFDDDLYEPENWFDQVAQSEIAVNFFIYTGSGVLSTDSFSVFCLTEPFYRRLINNRTTFEELKMKRFHCPRYASPTGKPINPSFTWFFVAVTKDADKRIVGWETYNGRNIPLDPSAADGSYYVQIQIEN